MQNVALGIHINTEHCHEMEAQPASEISCLIKKLGNERSPKQEVQGKERRVCVCDSEVKQHEKINKCVPSLHLH